MWISLFLSFYLASARPVAIREVASCADQLKFLGCDDIAKLAAQGASAYVEDLAHGQRLFVVPCTGNDHHAMYVAFWRRGSEIRLLKFDQFDTVTREFRSHHGLLAGHLTIDEGELEAGFAGYKTRYRFRSGPDGVSVHLMEQTLLNPEGRREYLYWRRR